MDSNDISAASVTTARAFTLSLIDSEGVQQYCRHFHGIDLVAMHLSGTALIKFIASQRIPTRRQLINQSLTGLRNLARMSLPQQNLQRVAASCLSAILCGALDQSGCLVEVEFHDYFDYHGECVDRATQLTHAAISAGDCLR